jgi:PKD repeat protein
MAPTADFTGLPRTGTVPFVVKFSDASKGLPTSWSWDFGDGGRSTDRNPSHTYARSGTYAVTLTVSNAYGSDSETKTGFVTAGGKPAADFTADERRGVKPFTVTFTDLSAGNPTSWQWDFGDGTTSTEQNPVHTYQQEGAYDVTLTVSNSYGTDTVKKTGATQNGQPPVATQLPATPVITQLPAAQGTTARAATTAAPVATTIPGFEGILAVTGLAVLMVLAKRH